MYNVDGLVEIINTDFLHNVPGINQTSELFGGGGLYIEFTSCSSYVPYCSVENSRYFIADCHFEGNKAISNEVILLPHIVQYRTSPGNDGNVASHGGGIDFISQGVSFNNTVTITSCTFFNNSAKVGGGINALLAEKTSKTSVTISGCVFTSNTALNGGGGALHLSRVGQVQGQIIKSVGFIYNSSIVVNDSHFFYNTAGWGGAVSGFFTRTNIYAWDTLDFTHCTWVGNTGSVGAAVFLMPSAWDTVFQGKTPTANFRACSFGENVVTDSAEFLKTSLDVMSLHSLESGVFDALAFEVEFTENVTFRGSRGSAIHAETTQIKVLPNSLLHFVNNTATNGGAMALHGFSIMELYTGSHVLFESNRARELGGAIYNTAPHQLEFIFSHKCFISHDSLLFHHPDHWNVSLTYINNMAKYGYSIFTDSLLPCIKNVGGSVNDPGVFLAKTFTFIPGIERYTIATSPTVINFTLPAQIAPGERITLSPTSMDDLNQSIPSAFKVTLECTGGSETNPYISNEGYLQIKGKPGMKFNLTLQTLNTKRVVSRKSGELGECPLGFFLEGSQCVCHRERVGVSECDVGLYKTFLRVGYWVGCTDSGEMITSYCPLGYCKYASDLIEIPRSCEALRDHTLCNEHRAGQLCGECEDGYSVHYHSDNFLCGRCLYGAAAGLVMYIFSQLLPLVTLFAIIMITKLKMTSGLVQSVVLFAHTVLFINNTTSTAQLSLASHTFVRVHTFLLGFLNLEFFRLDEISFCLWSKATVLDNLAFRYTTTLFTICLLGLFILIVKRSVSSTTLTDNGNRFKKLLGKMNVFNNAIVHGISAVLILSYTQYTVASFQILSRLALHEEKVQGGSELRYVVRLQGNVDYFGTDHLPYAIPAVFVLLVLSISPPLLLISYPLLWKIRAKLRHSPSPENDTTAWPIRKLLPLIDSFQGGFRDNRRMFAGLLFLWRLIIAGIFAFSTTLTEFYLLIEIALLTFFTIHAVARPYKRTMYNMIDAVMFANLAVINALSWYNSSKPQGIVTGFKLLLMYLPLACLLALFVLWLLHKRGLIPQLVNLATTEEYEPSTGESFEFGSVMRSMGSLKRRQRDTCTESDLFSRAEEVNRTPSFVLTGSEAGFELQNTILNTKS